MEFRPYDPAWLVELAQQQRPDLSWLAESLAACTQAHKTLHGRKKKCIYVHFVDPQNANQPGAVWHYEETIELIHPVFGRLKLDCLKDQRVGGVEFYDRLFS